MNIKILKKIYLPSVKLVRWTFLLAIILFVFIVIIYFFDIHFLIQRQWSLTLFLCVVLILVTSFDAYGAYIQPRISLERKVLSSIAVNRMSTVELVAQHHFSRDYTLQIFEHLPNNAKCEDMPLNLPLKARQKTQLEYRFKALQRGSFVFEKTSVRVPSPFGFWFTQYFIENRQEIKVYPDFKAITTYTLLAVDNHTSQLGIKRKPRRGEGLDFLQLRNYRKGDSLRQIDWKASSRRQDLISRQYQDERDQQIIVLMDCGRRMRTKDSELIHFDHALNASLLLSYIALRQGDSVGFLTFGGDSRWISPQKGASKMKNILSNLYDLHTTQVAPDYVNVAEKLSKLQNKRSLVILLTNSRDEDLDELMMAANLLARRHLVVLANIREKFVDRIEEKEVKTLDDALLYASTMQYLQARKDAQLKVKNQGVLMLDCVAEHLATQVCNSYLEVKRSGLL